MFDLENTNDTGFITLLRVKKGDMYLHSHQYNPKQCSEINIETQGWPDKEFWSSCTAPYCTRNFWKIEKIVTNEIMIQRKMGKDQQGY